MSQHPVDLKMILCLIAAAVQAGFVCVPHSIADDLEADKKTVRARGFIQGEQVTTITSPTTANVISIVDEGTRVNRGDLVVGLDDSRLNSQLNRQQRVTKQALDAWKLAEREYEHVLAQRKAQLAITAQAVRLAELAKERELGKGGRQEQEVAAAMSERMIAETEIDLARKRTAALNDSSSSKESDAARIQLMEADARLQQARFALNRLQGVTLQYRECQAELAILRARADELSVRRDHEQKVLAAEKSVTSRRTLMDSMKDKLQQLEEQIAQCQVFAPHEGIVQYASQPVVRPGRAIVQKVAQGATVRANQPILYLVNTDRLKVEAQIDAFDGSLVQPGQEALIGVDAFPNQQFRGVVTNVTPRLIRGAVVDEGQAEYTVMVSIKPPHPHLRLGLGAVIEIDLRTRKNEG